jgi:hypothetical protein
MTARTSPGDEGAQEKLPATPDDLLATCWSSAGGAASDRPDLRSPLSLRERVEAASSAVVAGIAGRALSTWRQWSARCGPPGWRGPWGVEILSDEHRSMAAMVTTRGRRSEFYGAVSPMCRKAARNFRTFRCSHCQAEADR